MMTNIENEVRTRFAPSPTGFMHLGNLRTALYAFLFAKHNHGKFILRIEDTDLERQVEGAQELVMRTMKDTGLQYDEGPDCGGAYGPYIQTQRKDIYMQYALQLIENGGAYYCFCSKERLQSLKDDSKGGTHKYDKHCLHLSKEEVQRRLAAGEPYVIRQNIPTEGTHVYHDCVYGDISIDYAELEDNILIKSDGMPTYNFANVVDDHLMRITHVIRGSEYLSSTPKYNLLYDGLHWERPIYVHLPPIMKDASRKLSKRYGDANYEDFIAKGYLKEAIINYIALLGWSPKDNCEKMSLSELIERFGLEGLNQSPSIFDEVKLRWLNGEYIKEMTDEEFDAHAKPYYAAMQLKNVDTLYLSRLLKTRVEIFSQVPEKIGFLQTYPEFDLQLFTHKKMKTDAAVALQALQAAVENLAGLQDFSEEAIHTALMGTVQQLGMKNGQVLWPVRIAVTGLENTPGGATEMVYLLGKEESLRRMYHSIERLKKVL